MKKKNPKNGYPKNSDRLAHYALAADKPGRLTECPDDNTFAQLLEAGSGSDDRQKMLDHILICEACYQKWLSVSEVLDTPSEKETATRFRSRRLMTAAGSACALAVGVMLYLSIDYQPMVKTDMERSVVIEPAAVSPVADQSGEAEGQGKAPAAMRNMQEISRPDDQVEQFAAETKRAADKVMMEHRAGKGQLAEEPELSAAAPQSEDIDIAFERKEEVTTQAMAREKNARTEKKFASPVLGQALSKTDDTAPFIEQFISLCGDYRENRLKQSTVEKLIEQGQTLLRAGNLPADEKVLIDEITEMLGQYPFTEKTTFSDICDRAVEFGRRKGYNVKNVDPH